MFGPTDLISLDGIDLAPVGYAMFTKNGSGRQTHVANVIDRKGEGIEEWVVFHSFITHAKDMVAFFDDPNSYELKPIKSDGASLIQADYQNYLKEVFFKINPKNVPVVAYEELFERYKQSQPKLKEQVSNFLIDFKSDTGSTNQRNQYRTYFNIAKNFSIIENLLKEERVRCPQKLMCRSCGQKNISHYISDPASSLFNTLKKVMKDSERFEDYKVLIKTARSEIRHNVFHGNTFPTVRYRELDSKNNEAFEYTNKVTAESLNIDLHAVKALDAKLEAITWNLLMDRIFDYKIFQSATGYMVQNIKLNVPKRAK